MTEFNGAEHLLRKVSASLKAGHFDRVVSAAKRQRRRRRGSPVLPSVGVLHAGCA